MPEPHTRHSDDEGHLFIIDGDLTRIQADAVLVPTDASYHMTGLWDPLLKDGWSNRVDRSRFEWKVNSDPATLNEGQQVWFANVGSIAQSPGPYVEVAREFVRRAAEALRYRDGGAVPARPYLLALNALGTGAGGMRSQRGLLIRDLVNALNLEAIRLEVDVVLVAWGAKQYSAARRAQRLLRSMTTDSRVTPFLRDPAIRDAVLRLSNEALLRRLVLFVGAGVSTGAGLPDWSGLLNQLATAASGEIDVDRLRRLDERDQAQVLQAYMGDGPYRSAIVEALRVPKYGLAHGLLASLDAHEVVTTNYDTLLEDAYGHARRPAVLPQSAVGPDGRWVLKLHGTVDDPTSIVLARQDYLGLPERSAALFGILQAMLMTKHMLFVGYSLTDDTFHRVMHDVRRARGAIDEPIGTALTLFDDPLLLRLWGDVLEFVPMAPRPSEVTDADIDRAARRLEIVLDEIAIRSADVSAFLLDQTYDGVLDERERVIRAAAATLLSSTRGDAHIGASIRSMLSSLTDGDPKDR